MKIEITKQVPQVEIIDVEIPYYYKQNLDSDYSECTVYGKIDQDKYTSIQEETREGKQKYEVEEETYDSIKNSGLAGYFSAQYKSSKDEYEAVKSRCLSFFNSI